jgi:hypothetical protein
MRTAFVMLMISGTLGLTGCYRPDLKMVYVRPTKLDPPPYTGVKYDFEIENVDYAGNFFMRPTEANGPVVVQAYLSSDGVQADGGPAGGVQIVAPGSTLAKGARLARSFQAEVALNPAHPFLLLAVKPSSAQTDRALGNNRLAAVIAPAPLTDLSQWLVEHPWIKRNLKWETPAGTVLSYDDWPASMKSALQSHVAGMASGTPVPVTDPPPLASTPSGTAFAETTFTEDTAKTVFLAQAARSIVSDDALSWKAAELNDAELAYLFDSRKLFGWSVAKGAYFRHWADYGRATPGDPSIVYDYMQANGLIGTTRVETLHKVLDWSRNLVHYLGGNSAANYINHWQYAGDPPMSRILAGTVRSDDALGLTRNYTAGCWGTSGLLALMLRTVNIPATHTTPGGHSLPHFVHEGQHLTHGDDPYNANMRTSPWIPIAELPISASRYNAWFGSGVSFAQQTNNVGRRVCELSAQYLSRYLTEKHCADLASGESHETSQVYAILQRCHSLAELEAMNLWDRLDDKAVELGICTP